MGQYLDNAYAPGTANGAIAKYARVKKEAAGTYATAGINESWDGTATNAAADGGEVTVKLRNAPGTHRMISSEAITAGSLVYTESDGEVQDTAATNSFLVGKAWTASGGDGDFVEVLVYCDGEANT